ncbi:MAG: 50S ribosomal protein L32 [Candidatus Saccharibacteria bacterium]|nr:50S ribosomal protein L32 [Candidatus Saccharibacteria bacterium]
MAVPKKRNTRSKTGHRRSHLHAKLRRSVNRISPVLVWTPRQLRKHKATLKAESTTKLTKSSPKTKAVTSKKPVRPPS